MNKPISEIDVKNIQLMLTKGLKRREIATIIGCSERTVVRVQNGTHARLKPQKQTPIEENPQTIEQKLDVVIGLLKEIKSAWE